MSSNIEFTNLVENEVFDDEQAAFPPAPPIQRPTAFASPVQQHQQQQSQLPTVEGTPLRDTRLKLAHRTEGLCTIILAFAVFSFGLTVALVIELVIGAPAIAPHGGVSCSSELCSQMGVDQLKKGGNAIDAAITVMLCIGVVRSQSAGIGGGGLMIIHDHKTHNTTLLDFRESAPAALKVENQDALRIGGQSVGVPGEVAGMIHAHERFGQLPWNDLFTPVIKLAEEGWTLDDKDLVDLHRRGPDLEKAIPSFDAFRKVFNVAASSRKGRRKDLAHVYRQLATSRKEAYELFYTGAIGEEIVKAVTGAGGGMTMDDLKNYAVQRREPIVSTFKDFKIITFPAPSSGSLLIYMLNELEDLKSKDDVGTIEYYAKLAEITSKAFKCRNFLGDPSDPQVTIHEQFLTNKSIDADSYCEITSTSTSSKTPTKPPVREDRGTSHVNVIDNEELMVAVTSSLNHWFGSLLMTPSGILLNNEMDDFSFGSELNDETAQMRPLSSMVPTIVLHKTRDCLQRMTIGGTNGTKIPASVAQTLVNLLVKGDDLATAVEAPKLFCTNTGCQLENFSQAEEVARTITDREKLPVTIVDEKISTVGVLLKMNSTMDGYIEKSSYGKSITY